MDSRKYRNAAVFDPHGMVYRGAEARTVATGHPDPLTGSLNLDFEAPVKHSDAQPVPPLLPYPSDVCAPNTFASDSSISPKTLEADIKDILQKIPVDIDHIRPWEFRGIYYPHEIRTAFEVKIHGDTGKGKNACLVEMQLHDGDRCAFEGLCAHVRTQTDLEYAFADEWDVFGDDACDEADGTTAGMEEEAVYRAAPPAAHRSGGSADAPYRFFGPLPLPSSSLVRSSSSGAASFDSFDSFDTFEFSGPHSEEDATSATATAATATTTRSSDLVDVLTANTRSPFADVRRTGWQGLARATCEATMAQALLQVRVGGQDGLGLVGDVLDKCSEARDPVSADTQRCALKTLLNVSRQADTEQAKRVHGLKDHIVRLADNKHPLETRSLAVDLVQHMLSVAGADAVLVETLEHCQKGNCRVAVKAQGVLKSLKPLIC